MANIGKNIKRLRTEKGITQDSFSKMINVSRQAISSWETGRTQPDIEMLGILSDALEVSLEELIYGERRNVRIDNEEKNYISTATIVISILGGLLLLSGAILILVWCWDHIPLIGKGVFSVLPLAAGVAASVYVMMKKKDDSFLMELAASGWMTGAIVSVIFVNEFFDIHMGIERCMLIDIILTLSPMFIMRCVSPLFFYYGMVIFSDYTCFFDYSDAVLFVLYSLFMLVGVLLVYINRKNLGASRLLYSQWVTSIAALLFVWVNATEFIMFEPFTVTFSLLALYYALDKEGDLSSPFMALGTLGGMVTLLWCSYGVCNYLPWSFYSESIIVSILSLLIFVTSIRFMTKNGKNNTLKHIQIICLGISSVAMNVLSILNPGIDGEWKSFSKVSTSVTTIIMIAAFTSAIIYVVQGLKENKLYHLNLGFVSIAILTIMILAEYETDMLLRGCVLLVMGGILMFINLKIARVKEKELKILTVVEENAGTDVQKV